MTQKRVIAALALAFALGISFISFEQDTPVMAAEVTTLDGEAAVDTPVTMEETQPELSGEIEASDAETLNTAFQTDAVTKVTLTQDITISGAAADKGGLVLRRTPTSPALVVDLNGHNITTDGDYGFHVLKGHLQVTGQGTISAKTITMVVKGSSNAADTSYTSLTLGKDVTIAGANYGVAILTNGATKDSYGVKVAINGKVNTLYALYMNGNIQHTTNAPQITVGDGAELTATEGSAVYAAGYGDWTFGAAKIIAKLPIGAKAGSLTFNNTTITATDQPSDPNPDNNGINGVGSVFQIEHNKAYADNVKLTVNGGTYTSQYGDVFYEYGMQNADSDKLSEAEIKVTGGKFVAEKGDIFGGDEAERDIVISGGTFEGKDVSDFEKAGYLAEGVVLSADGTVSKPSEQPVKPSTPSTTGTVTSEDGIVSVEGTFPANKVSVKIEQYEKFISVFNGYRLAAYDIVILDGDGKSVQPTDKATVKIKVPAGINGEKSNIYYIGANNNIERMPSTYADGVMTFTTTHFSVYAIVEDDSKIIPGTTINGDGVISDNNSSNIAPEADKNNSSAPTTGVISDKGVAGAISTILPVLVVVMLASVAYGCKIAKNRFATRAAQTTDIPTPSVPEISTEVALVETEQEDRYVATPMTKTDEEEIFTNIFIPKR